MSSSKRIFVSCYAFSKYRGSEYQAGRKALLALAQETDIVCVIGLVGNHMGDINEVWGDEALEFKSMKILLVRPTLMAHAINTKSEGFTRFYFLFAFPFWHKRLYQIVLRLHKEKRFDIIHQLNPVGFREPGFLWRITDTKFIWGPFGGTKPVSKTNLDSLHLKDRLFYLFKNTVTRVQFLRSCRVKKAMERAHYAIFATEDTKRMFESRWEVNGCVIPEQGFDSLKTISKNIKQKENIVLWTGDESKRKNFSLFEDIAKSYHLHYTTRVSFYCDWSQLRFRICHLSREVR